MAEVKIAASILSADFARLGEQVREAEAAGADWVHVDVMDGHFVPNLTLGPRGVEALRAVTRLPLDVHLMIEEPDRTIPDFARAGADLITVQVEACPHLHRTVELIKEQGVSAGVTLNPATSLETLREILPEVDLALVMSVEPGFGGQSYIRASTEKLRRLRARLEEIGSRAELEVDGGVNAGNAREVARAGATVLVAGSAVFGGPGSVAENLAALRAALAGESGRV